MTVPPLRRMTLFLAGLIGASGVALSAVAAHGDEERLTGTAAALCLAQAPALLALYAGFDRIRTATIAALLIGLGCLLFASDLMYRSKTGTGFFPMSAPTGGTMMILGWIALGAGALAPVKSES